jgi:hypothetical protein
VVLAVLESPVVRAAQVVPESPAEQAALENPVVQVGQQPEQKQAGPAPSRPRSPAEVVVGLTVLAVINPQRAGAAEAAALSAEEAGHLPKRPAIAVAAAWEAAEEGAVVEAAAAKKEAEGDAAAKRDERTKNT